MQNEQLSGEQLSGEKLSGEQFKIITVCRLFWFSNVYKKVILKYGEISVACFIVTLLMDNDERRKVRGQ